MSNERYEPVPILEKCLLLGIFIHISVVVGDCSKYISSTEYGKNFSCQRIADTENANECLQSKPWI